MADNVQLNPTTGVGGATVATDDVAGKHYQYVKIVDGNAEGITPVGADANGLSANVLRTPKQTVAGRGVGGVSPISVPAAVDDVDGVLLVNQNTSRKRIEIVNGGTERMLLNLGTTASSTAWQIPIEPGASWWDDIYQGPVAAVHEGTAATTHPAGVIEL